MPANAPLPGSFETDPRVHFDKTAGKWQYEDEDTGQEYEWNGQAWVGLIDEDQWKAQQAAYSVPGVDESTPANAVIARQEKIEKKRKKRTGESDYDPESIAVASASGSTNGQASSSTPVASSSKPAKPAVQPSAPKKTGVWVTNLPPNTTPELLASVFQKAGVLMIGNDGEPRIKMYYDDSGKFKGEALVMYFKEGSVDLAVTLLDDTELEMGGGFGNMRVREAEYSNPPKDETNAGGRDGQAESKELPFEKKKALSAEEKQRMSKRIKTMQSKITWHSDDDSDDPLAPAEGAPAPGASRFNRVVVLKGMFAPEDLDKDPKLLLELKEDVREEAETLGDVTSVILYDKEEDGVMTVKFKSPAAAQACVMKMNGRYFDGRRIYAGIFTGRERYKRSGKGVALEEDEDKDERARLDNFAQWLVDGEGEGEE